MIAELVTKYIKYLDFFFKWGWTILFGLILLRGYMKGRKKGLYKMKKRFFNYLKCFAIALIGFIFTSKTKIFDNIMLIVLKFITNGSLEESFGFTSEAHTLKEYLIDLVSSQGMASMYGGTDSIIYIMLISTKPYLIALVQLIYNVIFMILWVVIFILMRIFSKIFILIFKTEKKEKRRTNKDFRNMKVLHSYQKEKNKGGLVGMAQAFVKGFIAFTIMGSCLYTIAGRGNQKLNDFDFGSDDINAYYQIYQSVESYGSSGIYSVLNSVTDKKNVPFYLYFTDLLFGCEVEEDGKTYKFNTVNELGQYTDFTLQIVNLAEVYCGEDINNYLSSGNSSDLINSISTLFTTNDAFVTEFTNLIESFNDESLVIKFTMSAIDTIASNLSSTGLISGTGQELLSICFEPYYLSDKIPDERELKESNKKLTTARAVIKPSQLISKYDVTNLLTCVLKLIDIYGTDFNSIDYTDFDNLEEGIDIILDTVKNLSLFTSNPSNFNKFLTRLYCYAENAFLTNGNYDGIRYEDFEEEECDWLNEIDSLLRSYKSVLKLYKLYNSSNGDISTLLHSVFDSSYEGYSENKEAFLEICKVLKSTTLIDKVLNSSYITNIVSETLNNALSSYGFSISLPEDIRYTNKYYKNGNIEEYGELTYLFNGAYLLCSSSLEYIDLFTGNSDDSTNTSSILDPYQNYIDAVLSILDNDSKLDNLTLKQCICKSSLLRSAISGVLIGLSNNNSTLPIYIPTKALETNSKGETLNIITENEFDYLLSNIKTVLSLIPDDISGDKLELAQSILQNESLIKLINDQDPIIEGIIAKLFINYIGTIDSLSDYIVIPTELDGSDTIELEKWISSDSTVGESTKILKIFINENLTNALFEYINNKDSDEETTNTSVKEKQLSTDISSLFETFKPYLNILNAFDEDTTDAILDSEVIHYSISNILDKLSSKTDSKFTIIFPTSSKQALTNDNIEYVIKKSELKNLLLTITSLDLDVSGINELFGSLMKAKTKISESKCLTSTLAYYIVNNYSSFGLTSLPSSLDVEHDGSIEKLQSLTSKNSWRNEIPAIFDSIDELFRDYICISDINDYVEGNIIDCETYSNLTTVEKTHFEIYYDITSLLGKTNDDSTNTSADTSDTTSTSDSNDILSKLEDKLFTLNKQSTVYSSSNITKIDVLYNSLIVQNTLTTVLDTILCKNDTNTNGLIEETLLIKNCKDSSGYYTKKEINGLLESLDYLEIKSKDDIDVDIIKSKLGIDSSDFDLKIFINENEDFNNKTAIEIFNQSYILWSYLDDAIDSALDTLNGTLLDTDILIDIKGGEDKVYSCDEISNLINALVAINKDNKDDQGNLKPINFDSLKSIDPENLVSGLLNNYNPDYALENNITTYTVKELMSSQIVAACVTYYLDKNITVSIGKLIYNPVDGDSSKYIKQHPGAYENNVKIYKQTEIDSLLKFASIKLEMKTISDLTGDFWSSLHPGDIAEYVYDPTNGDVKSYLLVSTLSYMLENGIGTSSNNTNISIPTVSKNSYSYSYIVNEQTLSANYSITRPSELYDLMVAIKFLTNDASLSNISLENITIPSGDDNYTRDQKIEYIVNSTILRYNITSYFKNNSTKTNGDGDNTQTASFAMKLTINSEINSYDKTSLALTPVEVILSESEITYLIDFIIEINKDDSGNESSNLLISVDPTKFTSENINAWLSDENCIQYKCITGSDILRNFASDSLLNNFGANNTKGYNFLNENGYTAIYATRYDVLNNNFTGETEVVLKGTSLANLAVALSNYTTRNELIAKYVSYKAQLAIENQASQLTGSGEITFDEGFTTSIIGLYSQENISELLNNPDQLSEQLETILDTYSNISDDDLSKYADILENNAEYMIQFKDMFNFDYFTSGN